MTTDIIRKIIEDLKNNQDLLEPQKVDFLNSLCFSLYKYESEPLENEIKKLLRDWD